MVVRCVRWFHYLKGVCSGRMMVSMAGVRFWWWLVGGFSGWNVRSVDGGWFQ